MTGETARPLRRDPARGEGSLGPLQVSADPLKGDNNNSCSKESILKKTPCPGFPLHECVYRGDVRRLSSLIRSENIAQKDLHGESRSGYPGNDQPHVEPHIEPHVE